MNISQINFTWSDAWLLQAIASSSRNEPAPLKDVIAAGDGINHAVFTFVELQTGLAKLLAADLIRHEADRFSLSPAFAEEYAGLTAKRRTMHAVGEAIRKYLGATGWQPGSDPHRPDPDWAYPGLTQVQFDEAVDEYLQPSRRRRKKKKKKGS